MRSLTFRALVFYFMVANAAIFAANVFRPVVFEDHRDFKVPQSAFVAHTAKYQVAFSSAMPEFSIGDGASRLRFQFQGLLTHRFLLRGKRQARPVIC